MNRTIASLTVLAAAGMMTVSVAAPAQAISTAAPAKKKPTIYSATTNGQCSFGQKAVRVSKTQTVMWRNVDGSYTRHRITKGERVCRDKSNGVFIPGFLHGEANLPPKPADIDTATPTPLALDLMRIVNAQRAERGLDPLRMCANLTAVAQTWATFIAPQFSNGTPLTINGETKAIPDLLAAYRYERPYQQDVDRTELIALGATGFVADDATWMFSFDKEFRSPLITDLAVGTAPTPHGQTALVYLFGGGGQCRSPQPI